MKTLSEIISLGAKKHPDQTTKLWIIPNDDGSAATGYRKAMNHPERYENIGNIYPNPKSPLEFTKL